jgi:hypothetical protein
MAGIFSIFRKYFNSRRQKRYFVEDGTFVIISPGKDETQDKKVQLIDISDGGMAFIYKGTQSDLETSGILKLLSKHPPYRTESIKFDTVSDIPAKDYTQAPGIFRRRGVKFRWMGFYNETALTKLIDEIKVCEK